ncbi:hypothetical protein [Streptomyces sp. NPDC005485]|uniref:rhamnogalacturonan lyase family protein n=1 Tax=Streptomyces sp. NPDC005485 TaxID=3155591 RepID=UPI0033B88255
MLWRGSSTRPESSPAPATPPPSTATSSATGARRSSPTDDHSALRLCTSTEPTSTRIYTLAQNPEYRLGRTVRGYLQSTYTDFYLGTETRRVPKPAITTPRIPAEGAVSHDDHA